MDGGERGTLVTATDRLRQALRLHREGNIAEAAEAYAALIRSDPGNADALHLLAGILIDAGNPDAGIMLARNATVAAPDFFAPFVTLGNGLQAAGRLEEAESSFRTATLLNPSSPEAWNNLASVQNRLGRHAEAASSCREALARDPPLPEALNNLGNALMHMSDPAGAETAFRRALELRPGFSDVLYNLGTLLAGTGRAEEALEPLAAAAASDPGRPAKHYNLANALREAGHPEAAVQRFRAALDLDPGHADARNNLAATLHEMGCLDEAESEFRRALDRAPEDAGLHWNLALVLLQKGDYRAGWAEYEWRWRHPGFTSPRRSFREPRWDGRPLPEGTLLVWAEQGLGDGIQFARFASLAAERCGQVVLECRPPLARLLRSLPGVPRVVAMGDELPPFDAHIPAMSLPHVLGATPDTIAARATPYLAVPQGIAADPRIRTAPGRKIGFAWAGSPTRAGDAKRSCLVSEFARLFAVPGTDWFSLQVGPRASELPAVGVADLSPGLTDFAATAAAMQDLDLVIAVDTAVVHLAGALGRPVWVLLSHAPGYLWPAGRNDSPWYPTARLFRQDRPGDWKGVFAGVREALESFAQPGPG